MDWPGLLRWSLKYTDGTSDRPRMPPEDMAFLKGAIQEYLATVEDPNKMLQESCDTLKETSETDYGTRFTILETMQSLIETDSEIPRVLPKLNVVDTMLSVLSSKHPPEVLIMLKMLGNALQNNPSLQELIRQKDGIATMMPLLNPIVTPYATQNYNAVVSPSATYSDSCKKDHLKDSACATYEQIISSDIKGNSPPIIQSDIKGNSPPIIQSDCQPLVCNSSVQTLALVHQPKLCCESLEEAARVKTAAMGALSGLIRHNKMAEKEFLVKDGLLKLREAFESQACDEGLKLRAANLLKSLAVDSAVSPQEVLRSGVITGLCHVLRQRDEESKGIQFGETIANLVVELLKIMRIHLARTGDIGQLCLALDERISFVESISCEACDMSPELKMLRNARKMANVPKT